VNRSVLLRLRLLLGVDHVMLARLPFTQYLHVYEAYKTSG